MIPHSKAVEVDIEADAAYVAFRSDAVATTEEIEEGVLVDFDAAGRAVGVEILAIRTRAGEREPASWAAGFAEGILSRLSAAA
jgi:uncharacterized protein YuzE